MGRKLGAMGALVFAVIVRAELTPEEVKTLAIRFFPRFLA